MYLSKINIRNYRGIDQLTVTFHPKLNVLIGENGSHKSALIDAIRLLYSIGEQQKNIYVSSDDFHVDQTTNKVAETIDISYEFKKLTLAEKGAYNAFLVCSPKDESLDYLNVHLTYENKNGRSASFSYYTGAKPGQKTEIKNFELFQHYYLSPLRNSTRDLLNNKGNVLSNLLMRRIDEKGSQQEFEKIIFDANSALLSQPEVTSTNQGINTNLGKIFQKYPENKVGLQIENSKVDNVINLIKPYLPFDINTLTGNGFSLNQNSLGYNNLIYIAIVLGDIEQRIVAEKNHHFALLIEEPEAHLHPQLLLNLYNFLISTNTSENTQLFITSHSPTLTSKVPLDNLILLDNEKERDSISYCFFDRGKENIVQDTSREQKLTNDDFLYKKKQLERYIDVTKSQLFYAKGILLIEGISEELLIPVFSQILGYKIEDFRIEIVNVDGISFYPILSLFNSDEKLKRLEKRVAILSDDDRYTDSKDTIYSFDKLLENNNDLLYLLHDEIEKAPPATRINNLHSFIKNNPKIGLKTSFKTFEYEISLSNVADKTSSIDANLYVQYIKQVAPEKFLAIESFYKPLSTKDTLSIVERKQIALLLWKTIPSKADFAQDFAIYLSQNLDQAKSRFIVPPYIVQALDHLTKG